MTDKPVPRTVYILGAGASKEVNLPMGVELKTRIAKAVDIRFEGGVRQVSGDYLITEALRLHVQSGVPPSRDINPYLHAGRRIRDGMPQAISIDNFVDAHVDDTRVATCAKLAIVRAILEAEDKSLLHVDRRSAQSRIEFARLEKTWYMPFFQLLTENCRKSDVNARLSSIAVVAFNYDRCIEQYLFYALQNYYGLQAEEASEALTRLEIHHPYGKVGSLPWMDPRSGIEFGNEPNARQLLEISSQIKTFTEGTDPATPEFQRITQLMSQASTLVFLGFAYHRLNLDLLFPPRVIVPSSPLRRIYGTAFGISVDDVLHIEDDFVSRAGVGRPNIRLGNQLTCAALFQEHWRGLSQP
jgi:hypothetical protein